MYCPKCGFKVNDGDQFCPKCGTRITAREVGSFEVGEKPGTKKNSMVVGLLAAIVVLLVLAVTGLFVLRKRTETAVSSAAEAGNPSAVSSEQPGSPAGAASEETPQSAESGQTAQPDGPAQTAGGQEIQNALYVEPLQRPSFFAGREETAVSYTASVPSYSIAPDLGNVINSADSYLAADQAAALAKYGFFVEHGGAGLEFHDVYENNRYMKAPNFVTVDSMMHAYHLYFSYLMKNTERNYLCHGLSDLSFLMLEKSMQQYGSLTGTEWENAAARNVAFFAVGASLIYEQGGSGNADAALMSAGISLPQQIRSVVDEELRLIGAAQGIAESPLTGDYEDYSQYIVRGYYEGDALLERYFRTMMWYGRVNFAQKKEDLTRSAALIALALDDGALSSWEEIYTITSFFAGASDDLGYYEYLPVMKAAYGDGVTAADLPGKDAEWLRAVDAFSKMEPPAINSVPGLDKEDPSEDQAAENKGFRFMGQRFSIDAAIFQNLLYDRVQENATGNLRRLPNALDIPAAFGSDKALELLSAMGETSYRNYSENMTLLRDGLAGSGETLWNASLYSRWLYTLKPLTEQKGEGWPAFMQSDAWARKDLQSFLGSYTELKHDTVLYSKQVMVEMGGFDEVDKDDRGYVEPEAEVFGRLAVLTQVTREGLSAYGILGSEDAENLQRLQTLAESLKTIAEKELRGELPTDEEFELIRTYGGQIEHFWQEVYKNDAGGEPLTSRAFPAAVVTDVATDAQGYCLELGTGAVSEIYVVVPVDGTLRIASGSVYSFYQFTQPIADRLTDSAWKKMMGIELGDNGSYADPAVDYEDWTKDWQLSWRNR